MTDRHHWNAQVRKSQKGEPVVVAYCPVCWGTAAKLIALVPGGITGFYQCIIHKAYYLTESARREYEKAANPRVLASGWVNR